MIKLFYSGTYNVRHELVNKDNVLKLLKEDIRTKIVGNVKSAVYASDGVVLKNNKNVMYIGGFYFEKEKKNKSICESVVDEELNQIDKCDLLIANLTKYSAIATVTEIIYAAFNNKKIVIFCDPSITSYEVNKEYWFPILTCKKINKKVEIKFIKEEKEILDYIINLKEE